MGRYTVLTDSCSWLLLRHLAQKAPTLDAEPTTVDEVDLGAIEDSAEETVDMPPTLEDLKMPRVSFDDARRIMTRTDFVEELDHLHVSLIFVIQYLALWINANNIDHIDRRKCIWSACSNWLIR